MKIIRFFVKSKTATVDDSGEVVMVDSLTEVEVPYSEDNLAMAKEQSYNGEIEEYDDGLPEIQTPDQRIAELEEALAMLLSGVTE